jgi:hypothetical protein
MSQYIFESLLPVIAFGVVYVIAKISNKWGVKSAVFGIFIALLIHYRIIYW